MIREFEYDQPMLAAIKTLNFFHGDEVTIGDLKWAFAHFGGGSHGCMRAIERVEGLVPGIIEPHYHRRAGDYSWVTIEVIKRVKDPASL